MYFSKQVQFNDDRYSAMNKRYADSMTTMTTRIGDAEYFSLENNQNAQDYFENGGGDTFIAYEKLIPHVKDQLLNFNDDPNGNPYTGQDKITENKFVINKIKVLNHRWIIADFSDGNYWGEVLLKYFVNEDESISFEVIQSLLHQKF
jgi:hypothetical protein